MAINNKNIENAIITNSHTSNLDIPKPGIPENNTIKLGNNFHKLGEYI